MKTEETVTVPEFVEALIGAMKRSGTGYQMLTAETMERLLREVVPASPPPVQRYPKWMHCQRIVNHAPEKPAVLVQSAEQEAALGEEWGPTPPRTHEDGYPRLAMFHYPGAGAPCANVFGNPSNPQLGAVTENDEAKQKELKAKGWLPSKILVNSPEELAELESKGRGWC